MVRIAKEPIMFIDATPDDEYPLRILRAYRANCEHRWTADPPSVVIDALNEAADKRAQLLDRAIDVLESDLLERRKTRYAELRAQRAIGETPDTPTDEEISLWSWLLDAWKFEDGTSLRYEFGQTLGKVEAFCRRLLA